MERCCFRLAIACLALVVCASHQARAQEEDLSASPAKTATLFSQIEHHDFDRASFSFELGVLGDEKLPERRAYYDLRFGGVRLDSHAHWFDVGSRRATRSQLKDLGELTWSEVYHVPVLFANAVPHDGMTSYKYDHGKVVEISPANINVKAIAGHMYVMHVKDKKADFYVMFRVESVKPEGECTISWKRVPSPDGDQPIADSDK